MRLSTSLLTFFLATVTATSDTPLSTLTIHPACPSTTPSDAIVTRSNAPIPSCAAGNETKPLIISMDGNKTMTMTAGGGSARMTPSMSSSGSPAQFTGAAGRNVGFGGGVLAAVGGAVVAVVV
ncbi:hypothetical protein COCC4DRAFT_152130 [Bipolaris maydis ATCC 48331]|uniref:Uncharacterized protein n=2 Tax=Cochliobolus heterostrophus TaxID=5016 RepID=M2TVL4_COCH5|nr:uncharacterized protein COCC4DRAFT_152130 [Bipolaris maydis ATCC 48331]EMD85771.1 hypothetical protein COCHEDRAFT_1118186 [Bipolaris maydis C5]ENH99842.1 hypothetical protein COCC4DRAFT_152130 [Bipolaris maydis ATCC 48331]KAJ6208487.1 hypothetical protein PSV09DRAFT_1118186 [Bipolaris maydis]